MLIEERMNKIMELIKKNESVKIEKLAEELQVSKDTIRRDLIQLENMGKVKRTHGGAVLAPAVPAVASYNERKLRKNKCKEAIGKKTAEMIGDDTSIIFDSATTVEAIIPFLGDTNIFAITNTLSTATQLSTLPNCKVSILPGILDNNHLFITGIDTVKKLSNYRTDYALLGAFALNEQGIWESDEGEALVKEQMVKSARTKVLMVDSTKFNTTGLVLSCKLDDIDLLITEKFPDGKLGSAIKKSAVNVIIAN